MSADSCEQDVGAFSSSRLSPQNSPSGCQGSLDPVLDDLVCSGPPPVPRNQTLGRVLGTLRVPGWVCELGREFRTFLHRSGTLIRLRKVPLCDLGPHFGEDSSGHLTICTRTRGRRWDTHRFQRLNSWSSLGDLEIFLAGWNAGARWCDESPHSCCCTSRNAVGQVDQLPCMSAPFDVDSRFDLKPVGRRF
jgi:hypothetical protein